MRKRRLRTGLAGLGMAVALLAPAHGAQEGLLPYQLVRSLELVQDRIAAGDHAALPMQRKLLEMTDARFRRAEIEEFDDGKNVTALLVYAMSGGNPVTVDATLSRLPPDHPGRRLGAAISLYLNGRTTEAQGALGAVDPLALTPELGAYVALVKGSVLSADKPAAAIRLLDQARLLGTGSLVEEAALRRSIALSVELKDQARFMLAATQYVRGFINSPYASQFADAFVEGVVALHDGMDLERLGSTAALMDAERERVIYLRIARRAAIEGLTELSAFAAARAAQNGTPDTRDDPRLPLYSILASITSGPVDDVAARLAGIDRNELSASDRQLLDAAEALAAEMTAKPPRPEAPKAAAADAEASVDDPVGEPARQAAARQVLPGHPGPEAEPEHAQPEAAPGHAEAALTALPDAPPAQQDPAEILISEVRDRLADIDRLLEEAAE